MRGTTELWRGFGPGSIGSVVGIGIVLCGLMSAGSAPARTVSRRVTKAPLVLLERTRPSLVREDSRRQRRQLARQVESQRRWGEIHRLLDESHVSRKSQALLRQRGLGPALHRAGMGAGKDLATTSGVDTLDVLVVRISFASDRSGPLTSVTEDGNFTLRPAEPEEFIDPPPHNRAFYESHLFGLSEYYRMQSGGRLVIRGTVLPRGDEDSYQLSDLADYGPGAGAFWTIESLERLVRDMIAVTDSTMAVDEDSLSLADFDDSDPFTYIIFVHAGGDWQGDINNDSPNDVPTFFISLGEPEPLAYSGGQLSECSVIPETISQDGFVGSIAASLYHEFGHALGLVDIYDTWRGLPQVGIWSLMDTGTNVIAAVGIDNDGDGVADEVEFVLGLLPPSLSAWDKWFLGWLEYANIAGGEASYRLPAVQVPREDYWRYPREDYDFRRSYPQALIGGSSPGEFFLIENRWVPLSADELPDAEVFFVSDPETGVILYLGGDEDVQSGQPRNTGMYDFFLPDGGLLVWHVNMNRIEPNLATNTINTLGDGLRLVEADGIQDIGVVDAYVLGFFGSFRDPFNEDNGDALHLEGTPSSRAFDRSWTGLQLQHIAGADPGGRRSTMSLTAGITPLAPGSSWAVAAVDSTEAAAAGGSASPRALDATSATPVTFQRSGTAVPALIVADVPAANWDGDDYRAKLFVWRPDGTPALWSAPGLPPGAAWEFAVPLAGPPVWTNLAAGTMPPGEEYALVVGLGNGEVVAFDQNLNVVGGLQARWGPIAVGAALAWAPTPDFDANLLCCVPPDTLVLLDGTGARRGEPLILSAVGGDDFTGFAAPPLPWPMPAGGWSVFGPDGWYRVSMDLDGLQLDSTIYPYSTQGSETVLRRALVPASDVATLLVFDDTGVVGSWHLDTAGQVMVTSWSGDLNSGPVAEPAVADLDGNGRNDLILLTTTHVRAYQADGVPLTGYPVALAELFPLPDTTRIAGPVVVCDATGDGVNELFFTSDQGHLLGLDARGQLLERTPFLWGRTGPFGLAVGTDADTDGRILWLLEGAGRTGPPLDRRFDNGKLVGYRMAGSGQQTSEWLGTAGGGNRLGPVGVATPLAAPAPWKQEVDRVIFYPNPMQGNDLTVRFFSHGDQAARLVIFNLEGEIVLKETIAVASGQVNEHRLDLPSLVSGMYVCQLERQTSSGLQTSLTTLAVER